MKVSQKLFSPYKGQKGRFMTAVEGVANVRKGLFAFIMELSTMYKIIEDTFYEHEKCGLINVVYLKMADPYLGKLIKFLNRREKA